MVEFSLVGIPDTVGEADDVGDVGDVGDVVSVVSVVSVGGLCTGSSDFVLLLLLLQLQLKPRQ